MVPGNDGRGYVTLSGSALIHLEVCSLFQSGLYVIFQYLHFPLGEKKKVYGRVAKLLLVAIFVFDVYKLSLNFVIHFFLKLYRFVMYECCVFIPQFSSF